MSGNKVKILKWIRISTCKLILISLTIVMFGIGVKSLWKSIDERKKRQETKCIQNELFIKENQDFIKQNKKCSIIDNKIYIYENGDLVRDY